MLPSLGMTAEVLGTLIGAGLQGQIVASAHVSHHCTVIPTANTTDSWHDTPSFPEPSDPLSPQVSVYGSTLKSLWSGGIVTSVCLGDPERDFLEISSDGLVANKAFHPLPLPALQNGRRITLRSFTEDTKLQSS